MYYAVCNVGGPISVRLEAEDEDEAVKEFAAGNYREWVDEPRTDAEDDLDIHGRGMSEDEFEEVLENAAEEFPKAVYVRDLSPIINAHAGTVSHLADGWSLWRVDDWF